MEKTAGIVLAVFLMVAASAGIAYQQGKKSGEKTGYSAGLSEGKSQARPADLTPGQLQALTGYEDLASKYNTLVNDYNNLRSAAIKYVSASQYQARQPITCNTYNYSSLNSSTTSCY